jgi:RNA polymerase sigma factor (sigma-70 family)
MEMLSLDEVCRSQFDYVLGVCRRMVRDDDRARDLAQESFVKIVEKYREFRGDCALKTWLYAVARNTVLSVLRKKELASVSLDEIIAEESAGEVAHPRFSHWYYCLAAPQLAPETQIFLQRLVECLRPELRLFVEGYSYMEIAQLVGAMTVAAIHDRIVRQRVKLRMMRDGQ